MTRQIENLIQIGFALKQQIGKRTDERKGQPGSGLLLRLCNIEDQLRLLMTEMGETVVVHEGVRFSVEIKPGRRTVDPDKFCECLREMGVNQKIIDAAREAATTTGNSYWHREWKEE